MNSIEQYLPFVKEQILSLFLVIGNQPLIRL